MDRISPDYQARIEALENQIAFLRAQVQGGATSNSVTDLADTGVHAATIGTATVVAAATIQALKSGLFNVDVAFSYSGATAAASNSVSIQTSFTTLVVGGYTLTNAALGLNSTPNGSNPQLANGVPAIYTSTASGGIGG